MGLFNISRLPFVIRPYVARARNANHLGGVAAEAVAPHPNVRPFVPLVVGGENAQRPDGMDEEPVICVVVPEQPPKRARHVQQ